jgi:hypothetical protein
MRLAIVVLCALATSAAGAATAPGRKPAGGQRTPRFPNLPERLYCVTDRGSCKPAPGTPAGECDVSDKGYFNSLIRGISSGRVKIGDEVGALKISDDRAQANFDFDDGDQVHNFTFSVADLEAVKRDVDAKVAGKGNKVRPIHGVSESGFWWADGDHIKQYEITCR